MRIDETVGYEEFVRARMEAVALTDKYREAYEADAPERDKLWERVVDQTETARLLLESWLESGLPELEESERDLVAQR